jgi:hypothetical protein
MRSWFGSQKGWTDIKVKTLIECDNMGYLWHHDRKQIIDAKHFTVSFGLLRVPRSFHANPHVEGRYAFCGKRPEIALWNSRTLSRAPSFRSMARDLTSTFVVNDSPNLLYGTGIERGCLVWKPLPVGRCLSDGRVVWNVMYIGRLARLVVGQKIRVDGSRAKSSSLLVIYNAMKIVVSQ